MPIFSRLHRHTVRGRQRIAVLSAAAIVIVGVALAASGAHYAAASHAARGTQTRFTGSATQPAQSASLAPFDASGLPAGKVMGLPIHATLPGGTNLKHVHGGPTYVYVISGSLDIVETDGSRMTYGAGTFFWEGPGHIHTVIVAQGAEIFELQLLPPGAESIVPVQ